MAQSRHLTEIIKFQLLNCLFYGRYADKPAVHYFITNGSFE